MEVVGGQCSKDSESNEGDERPVSNLVLFWSADPHLLDQPLQSNTTKELVHFFPQVPYLLKTDGWDFVLEKTFVHLLGFFFKVDNRYFEFLKCIRHVSDVCVVGGIGFAVWPFAVLVEVAVGDTAICLSLIHI